MKKYYPNCFGEMEEDPNGCWIQEHEVAELTGQVEKLREALRAVDEWDLNWADGLDSNVERVKEIVRAAIGGEKS